MKKLLLTFLTLFLMLGGAASAKPLKPIDIVNSLNICNNFNSSLGQLCKTKFNSVKYFNSISCSIAGKKITYRNKDDWEYVFAIIKQDSEEATVQFWDSALIGTYNTEQLIKLKYDKQKSKWIPYSSEVTFRNGLEGNKKESPKIIKNPKEIPSNSDKSICTQKVDFFDQKVSAKKSILRKSEFKIFNEIPSFFKLMGSKEFKNFLRNNISDYKVHVVCCDEKMHTMSYNMFKFFEYQDKDFHSANNSKYTFLAGIASGTGSEKGLLWIDKEKKIAVGMVVHYLFNKEPFDKYGAFLIFSKDLNNADELPDQFIKDLKKYLSTVKLSYDGNAAVDPSYPNFSKTKRNFTPLQPKKIRFINSKNEISDITELFKNKIK